EEQIAVFARGTPYLKLDRPCTPGDGIQKIDGQTGKQCLEKYHSGTGKAGMCKFVPASGAATRMFKTLIKADKDHEELRREKLQTGLPEGEAETRELLDFFNGIRRFAFYPDLAAAMAADGLDAEGLLQEGNLKPFLQYLLTEKGLDYGKKPKGLLKFHTYSEETRTAFAEHLVEAAGYSRNAAGESRLHFTVSPQHQAASETLLDQSAQDYTKRLETRFSVDFSVQAPHTDTIAVDMDNQPFRRSDGSLLFRPGGHGALLENLNRIEADLIFIKNIDNVVHDRFKPETNYWKQLLCGFLLLVQEQIFSHIQALRQKPVSEERIEEITRFVEQTLCVIFPQPFYSGDTEERRSWLLDRLCRPLRVCGMVPNSGEPGGGPFWVADNEGRLSIQIVETSQIDPDDQEQQEIQQGLTHFNPVDLVCAPRDPEGKPYDLRRFVDPEAVFIAHKSEQGKNLKALEHPGLWNGAMAFWNTVFVEVPLITFNPVKRVNDLLRGPHQPTDA
ncbi:MAG TPA: DUF4301 family protein, partial [Desulfosalsimonadaceae bacterium]|nr:DUF4301 family protein [Desulfosalsimonadaceae bacterium]